MFVLSEYNPTGLVCHLKRYIRYCYETALFGINIITSPISFINNLVTDNIKLMSVSNVSQLFIKLIIIQNRVFY